MLFMSVNRHFILYEKKMATTRIISVMRKDWNCKFIFIFPQNNLPCKGLNITRCFSVAWQDTFLCNIKENVIMHACYTYEIYVFPNEIVQSDIQYYLWLKHSPHKSTKIAQKNVVVCHDISIPKNQYTVHISSVHLDGTKRPNRAIITMIILLLRLIQIIHLESQRQHNKPLAC